jgi:hypothetical protein
MVALFLGCSLRSATGQEPQSIFPTARTPFEPHYYRLVFVVKEFERGTVTNNPNYLMTLGTVDGSDPSFTPRSSEQEARFRQNTNQVRSTMQYRGQYLLPEGDGAWDEIGDGPER